MFMYLLFHSDDDGVSLRGRKSGRGRSFHLLSSFEEQKIRMLGQKLRAEETLVAGQRLPVEEVPVGDPRQRSPLW